MKRSPSTALSAVFLVWSFGFAANAAAPVVAAPARPVAEASGDACDHEEQSAAQKTEDASDGALVRRGVAVAGAPSVTVEQLLASARADAGKTLIVEGTVRRACTRMGCWMELASKEGPGVRVTFKDEGFFVPTTSAGRHARVLGVVKLGAISAAQARHEQSEGGAAPSAPVGKSPEVQLIATGVELRR